MTEKGKIPHEGNITVEGNKGTFKLKEIGKFPDEGNKEYSR